MGAITCRGVYAPPWQLPIFKLHPYIAISAALAEGLEVGKSKPRMVRRRRVRAYRRGSRPSNKPRRASGSRPDLRRQPRSDGRGLPVRGSQRVRRGRARLALILRAPLGTPDLILAPTKKTVRDRRSVASGFGCPELFPGRLERPRFSLEQPRNTARTRRRRSRRQLTALAEPGRASHPYRMPPSAREKGA